MRGGVSSTRNLLIFKNSTSLRSSGKTRLNFKMIQIKCKPSIPLMLNVIETLPVLNVIDD